MFKWVKKKIQAGGRNGFNWVIFFAVALMALTSFVFVVSYRLALVGQEEVAVPNLINKELPEALQDLQAKNLTSHVTLRFSDNTFDTGRVIDQEPKAGFVLRAGRKVSLTVSRGVILGVVPNFVGQNIEDAKNQVTIMYAKTRPLMVVVNPMIVPGDAPVGTILSQSPAPGVEISSLVEVNFRVSGGKMTERQTPVANYVGLSYTQVLQNLFDNRLPFHFTLGKNLSGEGGVIASQSPVEGEYIGQNGLSLSIKAPFVEKGNKFILIESSLPSYPVYVKLDVNLEEPNGNSHTLYSFYTKGERIAIPAVIKDGSTVNLMVFGKLVERLIF